MTAPDCETDIGALILLTFEGRDFWLSPGTLLQCLHVAANESRVPPLDPEWIERAIPPAYRAQPRRPEDLLNERPDRAAPGQQEQSQ